MRLLFMFFVRSLGLVGLDLTVGVTYLAFSLAFSLPLLVRASATIGVGSWVTSFLHVSYSRKKVIQYMSQS
jgi:hypothetical protein